MGDLVFRKDPSYLSHLFSLVGGFENNRFSHVGIIAKISPIEVWHVYDKGNNALQKDSLKEYLAGSTDHAFFRRSDIDIVLMEKALEKLQNKIIKFDYQFSRDNDRFYCSEFIYYLLLQANSKIENGLTTVSLKILVEKAKEVTSSQN